MEGPGSLLVTFAATIGTLGVYPALLVLSHPTYSPDLLASVALHVMAATAAFYCLITTLSYRRLNETERMLVAGKAVKRMAAAFFLVLALDVAVKRGEVLGYPTPLSQFLTELPGWAVVYAPLFPSTLDTCLGIVAASGCVFFAYTTLRLTKPRYKSGWLAGALSGPALLLSFLGWLLPLSLIHI